MKTPKILINEREVLKLPNKSYSWFYAKKGWYIIKTFWGRFYSGMEKAKVRLDAVGGRTYYLRLRGTRVSQGKYNTFTSGLDIVTKGLALKEMRRLKKYSKAKIQKVH